MTTLVPLRTVVADVAADYIYTFADRHVDAVCIRAEVTYHDQGRMRLKSSIRAMTPEDALHEIVARLDRWFAKSHARRTT